MTFLPLYNIFLFHTPHPHKGDGLTAVPFVFCFFNHPPARIPPHCAHYSAVRTHQHTNPDHCCTHSNERGQPGKTACRKTPAPAASPDLQPPPHSLRPKQLLLPPRCQHPPAPLYTADSTPRRQPPPTGPLPPSKHHPAPHRLLAPPKRPRTHVTRTPAPKPCPTRTNPVPASRCNSPPPPEAGTHAK